MNKKGLAVAVVITVSILLAILTRYYKLGEAPAGLYLDEAGQGYSAYSILKTGKDEFGKNFPIVFRSFTDFKTPVYIYLIVPLIPIFGLTKYTVRLPSFIFSILTLPFVYLLVNGLVHKIRSKINTSTLGSLTILLLAISPWHILFGRTNFEVNVSVFFLVSGIYCFYRAIDFAQGKNYKPWWLLPSAILLAIGIPSYHSQRVVIPLMMLILAVKHKKLLIQKVFRKQITIGFVAGFLILLPTLSVSTTPGFLKRATGLNIFSDLKRPAGYLENYEGILEPVVNSKIFLSTQEFAALYTSYFSPRNIFVLGDSGPRSSFPNLSTFFLWQFPFLILGFYYFLKDKKLGEIRFLTLSLLIVSPIPAAVTRDPYSTIRSLTMVIPLLIIISYGIVKTYMLLKSVFGKQLRYLNIAVIILSVGVIAYSLAKLWSSGIVLNEYYRAKYWNYGWQQVSETIKTVDNSLPVIVDNARTEPYSQLLFFLEFDPETYQKENFEVPLDEYYTNMFRNKQKKIGKITTRPIDWERDLLVEQYLVGDALAISDEQIQEHNLEIVRDITYPDWSLAFRIVKTNPSQSQQ